MGSRAGMVSCQGNLVVIRQLITVERVKRRRVALPRVCGSTSRTLLDQQRHGTRQFSSRNSALTRSYGKNYKFAWSVHVKGLSIRMHLDIFREVDEIDPSLRVETLSRGETWWYCSFFLFYWLIIPFICGYVELRNPFKISRIFYFY